MTNRKQLHDEQQIIDFIYSGNATFTLVSIKTGTRFTYKVARAKGDSADRPWFAMVLTSGDNESGYSYAGCIFPPKNHVVVSTKKSKVRADAPSMKGLSWLLNRLHVGNGPLDKVEFWHEGKCGACGRKLTVPESIDLGLGPVCAGRAHAPSPKPVPKPEPKQAETATEASEDTQAPVVVAEPVAQDSTVDIYEQMGLGL